MIITKDRSFYKSILSISLPVALQNLITFGISVSDTFMLGRLGEVSLSASAIGNNIFFILAVIIFAVGSASSVMGAQYYGKKDISSIHKVMSIMYRVCIILAIIFTFISFTFSKQLISIFTNDILVVDAGSKYLRIISLGYVLYAITSCTITVLRSVKTIKISLVVYSVGLVFNLFLNWVLIFGNLGAPKMGVSGAAIATMIARFAELFVIVIFMVKFENKIRFKSTYLKVLDKLILKDFTKVATPIILNELFWSIGASMICIIVSRMGTTVVAANSINNIVNQFATLFMYGLSSASSVIIGNTIGEGNKDKVREYANTIAVLSILMGILAALIIYLLRPIAINFYNVADITKNIAREIMIATAIVSIFRSLAANVLNGALRGGGDNRFVFLVEIICLWGVAIPLGFIAAFVWKLPIVMVFLIIRTDEILKSIIGLIRLSSKKWIHDITR